MGSRPAYGQRKKRPESLFFPWRRTRDSNPRGCYTLLAFQASSLATRSILHFTNNTLLRHIYYITTYCLQVQVFFPHVHPDFNQFSMTFPQPLHSVLKLFVSLAKPKAGGKLPPAKLRIISKFSNPKTSHAESPRQFTVFKLSKSQSSPRTCCFHIFPFIRFPLHYNGLFIHSNDGGTDTPELFHKLLISSFDMVNFRNFSSTLCNQSRQNQRCSRSQVG